MPAPTRSEWLHILEIIAKRRPDQAEAEWAWVMEQLGLGAEHFLGVHEAVRQGRWRTAKDPAAYLKTAARREARRLGPGGDRRAAGIRGMHGLDFTGEEVTLGREARVGPDGEVLTGEDMLDHMEYRRRDGGTPVRDPDGVWRESARLSMASDTSDGVTRTARQAAELDTAISRGMARAKRRRRLPPEIDPSKPGVLDPYLKRLKAMQAAEEKDERDEPFVDDAPEPQPDWPAWAQVAGLSEWEKKVVEYRLMGISREQAMAEQTDEESRKSLQAAWKKMERTGEERLRKTHNL